MYNRTCNRKSPIAITIQSQIANRKSRDRTDAKKCVGGLAGLHFWTPMIDGTRRSNQVLPGALRRPAGLRPPDLIALRAPPSGRGPLRRQELFRLSWQLMWCRTRRQLLDFRLNWQLLVFRLSCCNWQLLLDFRLSWLGGHQPLLSCRGCQPCRGPIYRVWWQRRRHGTWPSWGRWYWGRWALRDLNPLLALSLLPAVHALGALDLNPLLPLILGPRLGLSLVRPPTAARPPLVRGIPGCANVWDTGLGCVERPVLYHWRPGGRA